MTSVSVREREKREKYSLIRKGKSKSAEHAEHAEHDVEKLNSQQHSKIFNIYLTVSFVLLLI